MYLYKNSIRNQGSGKYQVWELHLLTKNGADKLVAPNEPWTKKIGYMKVQSIYDIRKDIIYTKLVNFYTCENERLAEVPMDEQSIVEPNTKGSEIITIFRSLIK